jgi:hypothetical protein
MPDGINAAYHGRDCRPRWTISPLPLNAERRLPGSTVLVATATIRVVATEDQISVANCSEQATTRARVRIRYRTPWWTVGAPAALRRLTDYLASSEGRCGITMISRLEEGGWKLVHWQADPLIEPQPLQHSIREPSTSHRAAASQGDLDVESAQSGDCDGSGNACQLRRRTAAVSGGVPRAFR